MNECSFIDECRNKDDFYKCSRCENNPENFEKLDEDLNGTVHDRKDKKFYNFTDNFEQL